jgi:excisionase family DNA binding protein
VTELAFTVPPEFVEAIADRAAELLEERVSTILDTASPWLNVDEAADYLRCSRQRVYDLKSSGRIVSAQDGTRPLFHRDVLDAYLLGGDARAVAAALPLPAGSRSGNGRAK